MRIRFYLKNPNAVRDTTVFVRISHKGQAIKIYTDEVIKPKDWDSKNQCVIIKDECPGAKFMNDRMLRLKATIEVLRSDYGINNNNRMPTLEVFKTIVQDKIYKDKVGILFIDFFKEVYQKANSRKRLNTKNNGMPVTLDTARGYKTTISHLENFQKKQKQPLSFDCINLNFHDRFTKYLQEPGYPFKPLSANTIGSHFRRITAIMNEALERGLTTNTNFKSKYFVKQKEQTDAVYLTTEEILLIEKLNLDDIPRLDKVRDFFIVGCYTGLGYCDLSTLRPKEQAIGGKIKVTMARTSKLVFIPIHPSVERIFKKYDWNMPQVSYSGKIKSISSEKLNDYIKEVCEKIPSLRVSITKAITTGGKIVVTSYPKYDLISTQTARRSFISNNLKAGVPSYAIRKVSGHSSEGSLMSCARLDPDGYAEIVGVHWRIELQKAQR